MSRHRRRIWIGLLLCIAALPLIKYFSESDKRRFDREVGRLCAVDGGIKVHETVKSPVPRDSTGVPEIATEVERGVYLYFNVVDRRISTTKDVTNFDYFERSETTKIAGPSGENDGEATLWKQIRQIVRVRDGKVLSQYRNYVRKGGWWLDPPFMGDSTTCLSSETGEVELRRRTFIQGE